MHFVFVNGQITIFFKWCFPALYMNNISASNMYATSPLKAMQAEKQEETFRNSVEHFNKDNLKPAQTEEKTQLPDVIGLYLYHGFHTLKVK